MKKLKKQKKLEKKIRSSYDKIIKYRSLPKLPRPKKIIFSIEQQMYIWYFLDGLDRDRTRLFEFLDRANYFTFQKIKRSFPKECAEFEKMKLNRFYFNDLHKKYFSVENPYPIPNK